MSSFAATTEWEVRSTGSASNGGGFDTSASGTDYSQQDSPQIVYTDIVIDGADNTKATSAAHPFDSHSPGNVYNFVSGTGFTVQRAQCVSVASGVATFDRALGTVGSTGGHANLGGGVALISTIVGIVQNYARVWVKQQTITLTSMLDLSSQTGNTQYIGYNTSHGDITPTNGLAKPVITTATNSTVLIRTVGSAGTWFQNFSFSNTAATRSVGIQAGGTSQTIVVNCVLDGFSFAIDSDNSDFGFGGVYVYNSEIKNSTSKVIKAVRSVQIWDSYIHDNTGDGVNVANGPSFLLCVRSTFARNTNGVVTDGSSTNFQNVQLLDCAFYANTGDGVKTSAAAGSVQDVNIENCVFWGNGGFGVNFSSSTSSVNQNQFNTMINCAFGNNTSGARNHIQAGIGEITLTADPFISSSNFNLNGTAGGGAALAKAGFSSSFGGGPSTGFDLGPLQTSGGGSSSTQRSYGSAS